jgi:anti-anti-sigma factor
VPDLTIQVQEIKSLPNTALVVLNGSIDAKTVITFQTHLSSIKERGVERFVLDLENVKYVNSTGLGYLINLSDSVSPDRGGISLVKVQPKVKVVFDMLGLNAFFKIFQTREEALKHLTGGGSAAEPHSPLATQDASPAAMKGPTRELTPVIQPAVRTPASPTPQPASAASSHHVATPRAPTPAPQTVHMAPPAQPAPAAETLHVECQACKTLLAVKDVGTYKCPRCLALFSYVGGGKVNFLPRQKALPVQMSLNFSPECVDGLMEFVRRMAQKTGLAPGSISEVQAAVKETVETIRTHAYGGNENNVYHVLMVTADSELELRFADYGVSLNADRAELFGNVRKMSDRFEIKNHPKGGNVVTIHKKVR